jgi:hypothetical protein
MSAVDDLVKIDEDNLDREVAELPSLILEYSRAEAKARKWHNHWKNQMELLAAKVAKWARKTPDKYDLPDEPPVKLLEAAVTTDSRYQKAHRRWVKARYNLDMATAAVRALARKCKDIENLMDLNRIGFTAERGPRLRDNTTHGVVQKARRRATRKAVK